MALHPADNQRADDTLSVRPQFARAGLTEAVPRLRIPEHEMDPDVASQIVRDELLLDGASRLNLATFVTTWMEPQARELIAETLDKNMIDKDEYPRTAELERRCVNMIARLWHAHSGQNATGTSTVGSSEAVMLGGLALKHRWRKRQDTASAATAAPNIVMGTNVQVAWEKFARYFDVEPRYAPMRPGSLHLTPQAAADLCDANTIGVVAILGSTQDGSYEPVREIAAALDDLEQRTGINVPIHVDAASGGFIAPFIDPDLDWDFRVPRVQSINASGHKYGLVFPGVGWVVWRAQTALPAELIFHVNYLGGEMPTFALNFSRPGAQVVAQYYNLIRLGHDGYRRVHQACRDTARHLSASIAAMGPFTLLSDGSQLPVFAFTLTAPDTDYSVYDVSAKLREHGWLVPAYAFPKDLEQTHVLRIVVRNGFSRDMADMLLDDLSRCIEQLEPAAASPRSVVPRAAFHH